MRKESKEIEPYFSVWALLMWTESVRGAKGLREKSETGKVEIQNHFSHKVKLPPFTISKHILTWGFVIVFSQARKWSLWTVINWGQYYTQWNLPLSTRATLSQQRKVLYLNSLSMSYICIKPSQNSSTHRCKQAYATFLPVLIVSLYKWMKCRISANSVLISAAEHLLAVISTLSEGKNCVPFTLVDQVH